MGYTLRIVKRDQLHNVLYCTHLYSLKNVWALAERISNIVNKHEHDVIREEGNMLN